MEWHKHCKYLYKSNFSQQFSLNRAYGVYAWLLFFRGMKLFLIWTYSSRGRSRRGGFPTSPHSLSSPYHGEPWPWCTPVLHSHMRETTLPTFWIQEYEDTSAIWIKVKIKVLSHALTAQGWWGVPPVCRPNTTWNRLYMVAGDKWSDSLHIAANPLLLHPYPPMLWLASTH